VLTGTGQNLAVQIAAGGNHVLQSLAPGNLALLEQSYAALKDSVYAGLVLQTRLKGYLDEIALTVDSNGIRLDFAGLDSRFDTRYQADRNTAVVDLGDLLFYAGESLLASDWQGIQRFNTWLAAAESDGSWSSLQSLINPQLFASMTEGNDIRLGGMGNDVLSGMGGNDVLLGLLANDTLYGAAGDDLLDGGSGYDTLYGGAGDDVLNGGTGDDTLYGGQGNDSYLFRKGDGIDIVSDGGDPNYGTGGGTADKLRFLDVASTEITALRIRACSQ